MWGRYKPIAIVAGVIFLANIIVRILGLTVYRKSDNGQINSGLVFLAVLAVIMVVAAYWWSVRYPSSRALPELGLVLLSATIACVLIGPVFSGALSRLHHPKVSANPFDGGAGLFFSEIWHLLGIGIGGAIIGLLVAMAIGRDYRAQQLKEFTKTVGSKPHRVVRR